MRALQVEALESRFLLNGSSFPSSSFGEMPHRERLAPSPQMQFAANDMYQGDSVPVDHYDARNPDYLRYLAPNYRNPPSVRDAVTAFNDGSSFNHHQQDSRPGLPPAPPPPPLPDYVGEHPPLGVDHPGSPLGGNPILENPTTDSPVYNDEGPPSGPPYVPQVFSPNVPSHPNETQEVAVAAFIGPQKPATSLDRSPEPIQADLVSETPEPVSARPAPQPADSKGGPEFGERGASRSQPDISTDNLPAAVVRSAPKPAVATREAQSTELVPQAVSTKIAAVDPVSVRASEAPPAFADIPLAKLAPTLALDSYTVRDDERLSTGAAGLAASSRAQARPNTDDPSEAPITPRGNDGPGSETGVADGHVHEQPRSINAAALTNVLAFDVMALESSIDAFFQSIERVGHTLAENRTSVLYAAGMIGLAAAMAIEFSRRKSQAPAPSLVSERGTGIPFSDLP